MKVKELCRYCLLFYAIRADVVDERRSAEECSFFTLKGLEEETLTTNDKKLPGINITGREALKLVLKYNANLLLSAFKTV